MTRTPVAAALLLAALAGCGGGTQERNKAIARGYLQDVLLQGQWDQWDRYFPRTPMFNGVEVSREALMANSDVIRQAFPDFQIVIEDQIAEGDKVATRVTFLGTHTGSFRGVPPTGGRIVYRGIALDRILDGKVVEMWHEVDTLGMLEQIGVR